MPTVVVMAPGWEEKVKVAVAPYLMGAANDIADDVRGNLIQARNYRTGALYRSVRSNRNTVRVGTDHWRFVEFGTRRHLITVKRKKVLANRKTGQVFGKKVNHPGNRAYAPIRRAVYKKRRLRRGI
jgi:hypothetical protein